MDEPYLMAAVRYVELNPVQAGLADNPWRWKWSSAQAHRQARDDKLVKVAPLLGMIDDWPEFLSIQPKEDEIMMFHRHERTGRPLGDAAFLSRIEQSLDRILRPRKRGPKTAENPGAINN
jgi:putative transposase